MGPRQKRGALSSPPTDTGTATANQRMRVFGSSQAGLSAHSRSRRSCSGSSRARDAARSLELVSEFDRRRQLPDGFLALADHIGSGGSEKPILEQLFPRPPYRSCLAARATKRGRRRPGRRHRDGLLATRESAAPGRPTGAGVGPGPLGPPERAPGANARVGGCVRAGRRVRQKP